MPENNPLNFCRSCNRDFSSVSAFDKHRVGKHEYVYDLFHQDGRRCMTFDELKENGFDLNQRNRWFLVEDAERLRKAHETV